MSEIQKKEKAPLTNSERFTNKVISEFKGSAGGVEVTEYMRGLVQRYFIEIDKILKSSEEKRESKNAHTTNEKYKNDLPYTWENINLTDLSLDVVYYAKLGLDMAEDNHIFAIPYKNNKKNVYDINFMPGYNGIKYKAEKYALEPPVNVTIELVHSNDLFRLHKKSSVNSVETYVFEIDDPFDRGEIRGGFGYLEYENPEKNKAIILTIDEILKRKGNGAAEFWGGEKDKWENGKKNGTENIEGWFKEMCYKTMVRHVYSQIQLDPKKIDDAFRRSKLREAQFAEIVAKAEIEEKANTVQIDASGDVQQPRTIPVKTQIIETTGKEMGADF